METTKTTLTLTHYDRLKKAKPQMWDYVERDIQYITNNKVEIPIDSVDDFSDKNLADCLIFFSEISIKEISDSLGLPIQEVARISAETPQMQLLVKSLALDYQCMLNFELFNRKTFFFSQNLSDCLLVTELSVDSDILRLPFESCAFIYSSPSVVDAAFAFLEVVPEVQDFNYPISVHITSLPDNSSGGDKKLIMTVYHWRGERLNFCIKREVAVRAGWKIEQSLKTDWNELGDTDGMGLLLTMDGYNRSTADEEFYTDGLTLFRLILNSVLYLSSNEPDVIGRLSSRESNISKANSIKSKLKSKKARQLAKKESVLDFVSVGENIGSIYVDKNRSRQDQVSGFQDRKYRSIRYIVRGHWRNQAYGQNQSERKLIWIKPYYKGPEIADLVNRPYIVK